MAENIILDALEIEKALEAEKFAQSIRASFMQFVAPKEVKDMFQKFEVSIGKIKKMTLLDFMTATIEQASGSVDDAVKLFYAAVNAGVISTENIKPKIQ